MKHFNNRRTRLSSYIITVFIILMTPIFSAASEKSSEMGRYQMLLITSAQPKFQGDMGGRTEIFILDTKEGHMWEWSEQSGIQGIRPFSRYLIYQGKAVPGKKIGDIIESQPPQQQ